ncbi:hypothetical protein [Klebsiella sp. BIGb0407]|uniref:hypothetical protein n=1 Tax=Klebsiella sp. BIGb0407 TaxID=2940603 RepID=UPI002167F728|nr:hypothetical protein [Klebsiella sp. BIGb0407]MCS3432274.1 hypothetical protein [Klebsiella sp. BIGb0407]
MLGEKNHNGGLILNIYEELNKRTDKVDYERCFALEVTEKEKDKLEKFRAETVTEMGMGREIGTGMGQNHRLPGSIIKDADMINSINKPGVKFRYSSNGIK